MAESGLVIENLSKRFSQRGETVDVLRSLNLALAPGELVTVIGASGAGKTTLLKAIAGLEKSDAGSITFAGQPLKRGQVGYIFQKPILYPHLTARENILFGTRLRGFTQELDRDLLDYLLDILQLHDLQNRKPAQLSGGQAQRVGIARALIRKAPVVLFDEPLSSVDEELSATIRTEIQQLHTDLGFLGLYITHDQNEALQLGQRVAVLAHGVFEQVGSPAEILQRPASLSVARLTGYPALSEVETKEGTVAVRATALSRGEAENRSDVVLRESRLTLGGLLCAGELAADTFWTARGGVRVRLSAGTVLRWLENPTAEATPAEHYEVGIKAADVHLFTETP